MQVNDCRALPLHKGGMIHHDFDTQVLGEVDPLAHFEECILRFARSPDLACRLHAIARTATVRPDEVAPLDEAHDQFAFVDLGATKLVAHASAGREQVLAFHFAGDLVWVPARATHRYTLCPLIETRLVLFPAKQFIELVGGSAAVMATLLERTLLALHRCREKSISLGRKTAQERIAGFLVAMAERVGTEGNAGIEVVLPMSRRDIGDSLGLTIETVSRQFSDLRAERLIETSGRSVVRIREPAALEARAGHLRVPSD
ncbi:Nitrogen fixation regulation protein FixK [Tsuneonella dongtanensis]|uniref:Nitrogen fixation regulation protein FixK n=1 Tax=Tsuneonella dongtanensis TaxID=692370 RepID=A0A1B2AC15_9SPHN|nr:helix-turn-helix domain-containing protein [Tsuneonella dongtanensis]ANY19634.1 Nitrogen fixation regulation protein FixK [Tsuneonella dongtanensis]